MPTAAALHDASATPDAGAGAVPTAAPVWKSVSSTADGPPLRRTADPYAVPVSDPARAATRQIDYATPGWLLLGISVLTLGYDLLWTAMVVVGVAVENVDADALMAFAMLFIWAMVSILIHSLMLLGGLRMTQRRSLAMARLGAIVGLVPCGMCSMIQIPFAVWAIVVLHNSEAAQDFAE